MVRHDGYPALRWTPVIAHGVANYHVILRASVLEQE
jgi:hypothetical protein